MPISMRDFSHWAKKVADRSAAADEDLDNEAIAVEAGAKAASADTVATSRDQDFIGEWD